MKKYATLLCIVITFLMPSFEITANYFHKINLSCNDEWNKTYGGNNDDFAYSIIKTMNGYIIAGKTASFGNGGYDAWLIKVDEEGNEIWNKTYGGSKGDTIYDILETIDGYILIGETSSFGNGGYDAWLIKVDEEGNEIWNKTYGGNDDDAFFDILEIKDGYLITGGTQSFGTPFGNVWLIKVDKEGNEIWNKTYGGKKHEIGYCIKDTTNGYVIAGITSSFGNGGYDAWLIKVDKEGNEIWNKTYGGKEEEYATCIDSISDGYIMVGTYISYEKGIYDAWIRKIDEEGKEMWNKTYGGYYADAFNCVRAEENGYTIVGGYNLYMEMGYAWIVKVDREGNIIWNKTVGGRKNDYAWTFVKNEDKYAVIGSTSSFGNGGYDAWFIFAEMPEIEIEIKGGYGITIIIRNSGEEDFLNLDYRFELKSIFIEKKEEGFIDLSAGNKIEKHVSFFSIGPAEIKIKVGEIYKVAHCFIIGPFAIIL